MRPLLAAVIVVLVLSAGCTQPSPVDEVPDPPPPGQVSPFFQDPADDAESPYDLLNVTFLNLNGSFVVRLEIDRVAPGQPFPFYNVTMTVDRNEGGRVTLFAAALFDQNRSAPGVRPVAGVLLADGQRLWEACQSAQSKMPSVILHEVLAEEADLRGGGVVTHVAVDVSNHNGTVRDTASGDGVFPVRGGMNPYRPEGAEETGGDCPLFRDPSSPQKLGG